MKVTQSAAHNSGAVIVEPGDTFAQVSQACWSNDAVRHRHVGAIECEDVFIVQLPHQAFPEGLSEKELRRGIALIPTPRGSDPNAHQDVEG